jgi:renalase
MQGKVAVIGAGLTGLTTARRLADAGCTVVVFDKSRGLGGRLATRRTELGPIDHGAPGVPQELAAVLGGHVWTDGPPGSRCTGRPGASALVRPLAEGLDIRHETEIARLERVAGGWQLADSDGAGPGMFDGVILAVPAPQAVALLATVPDMAAGLSGVTMAPVWTLLLGFEEPTGLAQKTVALPLAAGLAIPMLAKPGQSGAERWTVHAAPEWSAKWLELDKAEAAGRLLAMFSAATGLPMQPAYIQGHRWRYARTARPLGAPCAVNADGTLMAGGDWTLGPLASHAVTSGDAMAARWLATDRRR